MQKQQVRMSKAATTAMAIRAHGGTAISKTTKRKLRWNCDFSEAQKQNINTMLDNNNMTNLNMLSLGLWIIVATYMEFYQFHSRTCS